ncbi:homeodomain-interacting protein kinase 2-like, partial [Mastacembelus armatus]|uniref:homeodomain-interacting protein kinase 2-like n=1 Tax=Mastacembelus armatus TaxID=205130 RepID=UPI000E458335
GKKSEDFQVRQNHILNGNTSRYLVLEFMGEGCFGKVAKCLSLITAQDVALKILKSDKPSVSKRDINMLEVVSVLDPVKTNVVQFFERFEYKGHTCLAFEMLDRNLCQLLKDRDYKPPSLSEIRPVALQLLKAFDVLKGLGVIHSDLKPDNVMLVNHEKQPFRVKLLDFGVSLTTSEARCGLTMQPLGYRAPEVTLGLPISEAIDMWGLGCVLAFLYLSDHLFPTNCQYQMMRSVVDLVGQPADHLLCAGIFTNTFFRANQYWDSPKWWLKTPREYQQTTGIKPNECQRYFSSLDDLVTLYPEIEECIEMEDRRAFVSLLTCLLNMDPEQRITAEKALKHPFVSMAHLVEESDTTLYVEEAFDKMEEGTFTSEAEEQAKVDGAVAILSPVGADSDGSNRSSDGVANPPDGAAAEEEPTVSQDPVSTGPADEASAPDGSSDKGAPVKVKKCQMKRIHTFFSRGIRTVFGLKKKQS